MLKYRIQSPDEVNLSLAVEDNKGVASVEIEGDKQSTQNIKSYFANRAYGVFGHQFFYQSANGPDLEYAVLNSGFEVERTEGDDALVSAESLIPEGSLS